MPTLTTAQFSRALRRVASALERTILAAERQTLRDAAAAADAFSSGSLSRAALAAQGHPYAKRDPRPPADPAIINVQSGVFRRSWRKVGPVRRGGRIVSQLVSVDPKARFLFAGTRRAIARPLPAAVLRLVRPRRKERLAAALRRARAS